MKTACISHCIAAAKFSVVGCVLVGFFVIPSLVSPIGVNSNRGSLVVSIVSQRGDYVVVAADSRKADMYLGPIDNRSCKVIALGGDTLFFETGVPYIEVELGKTWDALNLARAVYRASRKRDALNLSTTWGYNALKWFDGKSKIDLQSVANPDGVIVTGGFVNFIKDGSPSVQTQAVVFSSSARNISRRPGTQPPRLGQVLFSGVAEDLEKEFFQGTSMRAIQAFGNKPRLIGGDPVVDSDIARKAIQYAMDNGTEADKAALSGPIDTAILRQSGKIEWVERKKECYRQDQGPLKKE